MPLTPDPNDYDTRKPPTEPTNVARVACGCPKCMLVILPTTKMSELTEDVATKVAAAPKPEAVH